MKLTQILFFGFLFILNGATAQTFYTLADTAKANQLLKESTALNNNRIEEQYDLAFAKADSAQTIYEQALGKQSAATANALEQKVFSKFNQGKFAGVQPLT